MQFTPARINSETCLCGDVLSGLNILNLFQTKLYDFHEVTFHLNIIVRMVRHADVIFDSNWKTTFKTSLPRNTTIKKSYPSNWIL